MEWAELFKTNLDFAKEILSLSSVMHGKMGGVTLTQVFSKENLNLSSFMHTGPGNHLKI